jgi:hypothetical protein
MRLRQGLPTFFLALAVLASGRPARAETAPEAEDGSAKRTRFLGRFDALGLLGSRYGVDIEYLPGPHDGFAAYPFVVLGSIDDTSGLVESDPDFTYRTRTTAVGLDLQYRRYAGEGRGFFIAPGLEVQSFTTDTTTECAGSYTYNNPGSQCPANLPTVHSAFGYLGPSLDVGWQAVLPVGFVFAVSAGVHYRAVLGSLDTTEMPWLWTAMNGPGVRPRLRLEVGWAFP